MKVDIYFRTFILENDCTRVAQEVGFNFIETCLDTARLTVDVRK